MTASPPEPSVMTFWEHLNELRSRLIRVVIAFMAGSAVSWVFRDHLLDWITRPFVEAWSAHALEGGPSLHFPAPASLFVSYVKLSVLGGIVLAFPFMLYQIWAFVAPGLYKREKRLGIPFVLSSTLLFAGGGYFGWKVAFPVAFRYLLGFSGSVGSTQLSVQPTVMIGEYIEFISRMFIAFGVVFELPVVVLFLSVAKIVNHRHLIRFARYFIVIAFVVGAVITPPDPSSQLLLAIPLCILYGVSIGIAWLFGRKPTSPHGSS